MPASCPPIPRIHRLPTLLANQIAAGEVVERPASVVKELVENALDAGALRIVVDVTRGGTELIRVTDDGHGIHPDDLRLALDRHATSKIRRVEDLAAIRSLGFRGEALPSIGSVARLRIISRIASEALGRELQSVPGEAAPRVLPAAHPVGTTVEVIGLFHDVPARRRFLRTETTESLQVQEMARRLALSRDGLALRLVLDGRRVLDVAGSVAGVERLGSVLGRPLARQVHGVEASVGDMRLRGWMGDPAYHRSQSDQQFFFLNGRTVRDRQLVHAVRAAYGESLPTGRHPAYVLWLDLDAAATDVNVHPTKHEVRFRHARDVHDFVAAAVREALGPSSRVGEAPQPGVIAEDRGTFAPASRPAAGVPWRRPVAGVPECQRVAGRYLVRVQDGELWVADGLALCRAAFLAFAGDMAAAGQVRRRPLLVPLSVEVPEGTAATLAGARGHAAALGFLLVPAGASRVLVREFPVALADWPLPDLIQALARAGGQECPGVRAFTRAVAACLPPDLPARFAGVDALLDMAAGAGAHAWRRVDAAQLAAWTGRDSQDA